MSEIAPPVGIVASPVRAPAPESTSRAVWQALLLVTAFWWLATGVIVALQYDARTEAAAAVASTLLALLGGWMVRRERDTATPAAARRSLLGGALLWSWVAWSFYGGWIVGPGIDGPVVTPGPGLVLALEAIHAMWYHEAVSVGVLVLAWALTRGAANRLGFQVILVFWCMHQIARINVFLGVVNPATRFLPERLGWLTEFYGPTTNSALLPFSVLLLAGATGALLLRARRAPHPFGRHAAALLAVLVALGALEHLLLGLPWDAPLWDVFLRMRG